MLKTYIIALAAILLSSCGSTKSINCPNHRAKSKALKIVNAVNSRNYDSIKSMMTSEMYAHDNIKRWKKNPIKVTEFHSFLEKFDYNGKKCIRYRFRLQTKTAGTNSVLEIFFSDDRHEKLVDFWQFDY